MRTMVLGVADRIQILFPCPTMPRYSNKAGPGADPKRGFATWCREAEVSGRINLDTGIFRDGDFRQLLASSSEGGDSRLEIDRIGRSIQVSLDDPDGLVGSICEKKTTRWFIDAGKNREGEKAAGY